MSTRTGYDIENKCYGGGTACDGDVLIEFDDGHIPEWNSMSYSLSSSSCSNSSSFLSKNQEHKKKNATNEHFNFMSSRCRSTIRNPSHIRSADQNTIQNGEYQTRLLLQQYKSKKDIKKSSYSTSTNATSNSCSMKPSCCMMDNETTKKPFVFIYQNALPRDLCNAIYDITAERDIPWGTYVTKKQALEEEQDADHGKSILLTHRKVVDGDVEKSEILFEKHSQWHQQEDLIHKLAKEAVCHFIFQKPSSKTISGPQRQKNCTHRIFGHSGSVHNSQLKDSMHKNYDYDFDTDEQIHGVQVWALPATKGSSVPYHLDYAEYIRYTHNIIVPPLYAGTVQCTPYSVKGGTFAVHMGGLQHYQKHGYKGCLSMVQSEQCVGWDEDKMNLVETVTVMKEESGEPGWVTVPYRFNQGILHSGTLPHLSGKVLDIEDTKEGGAKRVVMGFNIFGHRVGEWVQRCPEHSDKFRKMVQIHQWFINTSNNCLSEKYDDNNGKSYVETSHEKHVISFEMIKNNRGLAKLLILAKKERMKKQWEEAKNVMTEWIIRELRQCSASGEIITVSDLLQRWDDHHKEELIEITKNPFLKSISNDDMHVHINILFKCGTIQSHPRKDDENCGVLRSDGLMDISTLVVYYKKSNAV